MLSTAVSLTQNWHQVPDLFPVFQCCGVSDSFFNADKLLSEGNRKDSLHNEVRMGGGNSCGVSENRRQNTILIWSAGTKADSLKCAHKWGWDAMLYIIIVNWMRSNMRDSLMYILWEFHIFLTVNIMDLTQRMWSHYTVLYMMKPITVSKHTKWSLLASHWNVFTHLCLI